MINRRVVIHRLQRSEVSLKEGQLLSAICNGSCQLSWIRLINVPQATTESRWLGALDLTDNN